VADGHHIREFYDGDGVVGDDGGCSDEDTAGRNRWWWLVQEAEVRKTTNMDKVVMALCINWVR
jgi:hypothetical protein